MHEKIITVDELQKKLNRNENILILDVRPSDQRREWHIAGSIHLDVYAKLNAGDTTVFDNVPLSPGVTVVTVCAAGRTSRIASGLLQLKGIDAYSLEGGMKAWNYAWNTAEFVSRGVKIIQVRRPAKGVLSYVVGSKSEAMVIDAALDPDVYLEIAGKNGWNIKYVTDTHVHADYVSRTRDLASATGATQLLAENANVDFRFNPVCPGDSIAVGKVEIEFVATPGHTWESTTLVVGDRAILTGDTLFVDGIGRPDLKADNAEANRKAEALYHSIHRIFALNPDVMVLPAHTSNAIPFDGTIVGETLGNIRQAIKVSGLSKEDFIKSVLARVPSTPPNYLTIAAINQKGSFESTDLAELEAGGNHCAISL